jgi:putative ABC transport system permease protein
MNLARLAWRNMRRRPIRSALSVLGVALAVGASIALLALAQAIENATSESLDERGADLSVIQRSASDFLSSFLPQQLEARIAALPGVTEVTGDLIIFTTTDRNRHVLVSGWPRSSFLWKRIPLAAGRLPVEGEGRAVVVGDFIADALGKTIGDTVDILDEKFRIVGVSKFRTLANRGTIVGPLDELQEVAFRRGQVTLFHVNLRRGLRGAERDALKTQIAGLGPVAVSETAEILRNDRNLSVLRAVSLAISVIALIIGGVNVLNTMLMAVQERTREIGIVVAIGLSDRQIITSILIEGVTLGTLGCCLGVLLGLLASNGFSAIPAIGDYISFSPTVWVVAVPVIPAILLCAIGSLYPAWRATRIAPAEALRRL